MQDHLLTRIKDKEPVLSELLFNGQDLSPLLLSEPHSLTELDKANLKECYKKYGRSYVEQLVADAKVIPFAAYVFISINCDKEFWQPKYDFYLKRNKQIKELLNK